MMKMKETNQL